MSCETWEDTSRAQPGPGLLIEEWVPIRELGAEAIRERKASSALPPLYFLHVWWARRPLVVSRAAVLGSVLPAWSPDWPEALRQRFPDEKAYREWFLRDLLGIRGDPVAARQILERARAAGQRVANPYDYDRAFNYTPEEAALEVQRQLVRLTWGEPDLAVADPMAGGGSIPFEALRSGLRTLAGELNPIAYVVLAATIDYPARFGEELARAIEGFGKSWGDRARERLAAFFPSQPREQVLAYLWARTVACPYTGKPVPLSPNWWLRSKDEPVVAVRLVAEATADQVRFEIVRGRAASAAHPERGTVAGGKAVSPWTGEAIPEDYIKTEAQAGRMGAQLYAVAIQTSKGKDFRLPTEEDLQAVRRAEQELARRLPEWEARGLVPREPFPETATDTRPLQYGMPTWADLFSPRQLLALCTYLETYYEVAREVRAALPADRAKAVLTYLALVLDKCADYNSMLASWHAGRTVMRNTFDRHDFSFKWSFGEMNLIAPDMGFDWAVDQILDAYRGIAGLAKGSARQLFAVSNRREPVALRLGNAAAMAEAPSGSLHAIVVDPPYYGNVMYGELSDFFYVWLKRTVGDLYPEAFSTVLTDKDAEAVANPARFKGLAGRRPDELADQDYERKMLACFREFHRVLRPDGVLTVMFTHKRADAWNALGRALIEAGFEVRASWPVRTESEHSLHQAKKNAAQSTILMVSRKRAPAREPAWWDEVRGEVRRLARERAQEYEAAGITGVDLYLATYGPTLGVLSRHWPVLTGETDPETGEPRRLAPEEALAVARREVVALRKRGLIGREVRFDPVTDFYLLAWDAFRAASFPADEARKLALAFGVDLEGTLVREHRVLAKRQDLVTLQEPRERRTRGRLDPEADGFPTLLDAAHTAILVLQEDGTRAAQRFLDRRGLTGDATFRALLQGLIRAIPATRDRAGAYLRPEAEALERLRQAVFPDLEPARVQALPPEQPELPGVGEEGEPDE
jgi:adenine-specific DNA methylase